MTSRYAAAMPVAASAIAPIRPPGRPRSRTAIPTSAIDNAVPPATRISGRSRPAWAASTNSSTTPTSVTATPATASNLPIQPDSAAGAAGGANRIGWGGVGRGGGGAGVNATGGQYWGQ